MNGYMKEREGFTIVERSEKPLPAGAEPIVIPNAKSQPESVPDIADLPDLNAVPSGPSSKANTTQATKSRKAPTLP